MDSGLGRCEGAGGSCRFLPAGTDEPKESPDPGDTEKPATPGEGALSSDLDRIPTEGEPQPPVLPSREVSGPGSPWVGAPKPLSAPLLGVSLSPCAAHRGGGLNSPCCSFPPLTELPKMESKDVQQLFKDVLGSAERGEQPLTCVAAGLEPGGAGQDPSRAQRPFLQGDLQLPGQGGWRWHRCGDRGEVLSGMGADG